MAWSACKPWLGRTNAVARRADHAYQDSNRSLLARRLLFLRQVKTRGGSPAAHEEGSDPGCIDDSQVRGFDIGLQPFGGNERIASFHRDQPSIQGGVGKSLERRKSGLNHLSKC